MPVSQDTTPYLISSIKKALSALPEDRYGAKHAYTQFCTLSRSPV